MFEDFLIRVGKKKKKHGAMLLTIDHKKESWKVSYWCIILTMDIEYEISQWASS